MSFKTPLSGNVGFSGRGVVLSGVRIVDGDERALKALRARKGLGIVTSWLRWNSCSAT